MTEKAFRQLNIDPEFKNLIRPLRREEYRQLELNLVMEEMCIRDSQFREHRLRKVVALTDFTDVFSNDFVVQAHNKTSKKFCSLIIVFRLYHQLDLISISPQVDILLEIDNLENIFEGGSR